MKKKKHSIFTLLFMLMIGLSLGYALLTQDLTILGISKVKGNNWDIHFERVVVNPDSVILADDDAGATIDANDNTLVNYTVTLNSPGDFYEFTVDVVNAGTVDGMIAAIVFKYNDTIVDSTNTLPSYIDYSMTYVDDVLIEPNHLLKADSFDTYKVRVEFRRDIENSQLPTADQTLSFSFGVQYIQADDKAKERALGSFSTDSWETIIANVGNGKVYEVGATKEIELENGLGTHVVRVANNSTPKECETGCISETACGFVLEFADIISIDSMNPSYSNGQVGTGNVGGWPASSMRSYLNDTSNPTSIINSLPTVLKDAIIDTSVISGYGCDSTYNTITGTCFEYQKNYFSNDKLYLLSTHEVAEDLTTNDNYINDYDKSYDRTRQLDYYKKLGVTSQNISGNSITFLNGDAVNKQFFTGGPYMDFSWWLRSAKVESNTSFYYADKYGINASVGGYGVSPAFRLGGPEAFSRDICKSFENDSWEEIVTNVQSGNIPSYYKVGDRKEIELGNGLGTHALKIVNISTPEECNREGFSQTACGFVLEFDDPIAKRVMNSSTQRPAGQGNLGGWNYSEMRTYLNDEDDSTSFYNSLPAVLKNAIIDTTVVSGHGSFDANNFTSKDKIYLLSTREVWEDDDGDISDGVNAWDTAYDYSRQLDFYVKYGLTSTHGHAYMYSKIFRGESTFADYWFRTPNANANGHFYVYVSGSSLASSPMAYAPAFRLAGPASTMIDPCKAFKQDSWDTIISNAQANNYSKYSPGCRKEITLGNDLGTQTLRVANNTTPAECDGNDFSQTACGFVLEFENIISSRNINSTNTNVGGWPASEMRTYLNDTSNPTSIINSLPSNLKNAVINTKVVSGHGLTEGENNFISTDKLYLLSASEIYGNSASYDTAQTKTRQLDFYANLSVSTSLYSWATKIYNGSTSHWWMRNANSTSNSSFACADSFGYYLDNNAIGNYGVSPAFRLK